MKRCLPLLLAGGLVLGACSPSTGAAGTTTSASPVATSGPASSSNTTVAPATTGTTDATATTALPTPAWPEVPRWAQPAVAYLDAYSTAVGSGEVEQIFPFLSETVMWWESDVGETVRSGVRDTLTLLLRRTPRRLLPGVFVTSWYPTEDGMRYVFDVFHEVVPGGCSSGAPCARVENLFLVVEDGAVEIHGSGPIMADTDAIDALVEAGWGDETDAPRNEERYADIARRLSSGDPEEIAAMFDEDGVWVDLADGQDERFVPRELFAEQLARIFAGTPDAEVAPLTTVDLGLPGPPLPAIFYVPGGEGLGVYRQTVAPGVSFLIALKWYEEADRITDLIVELEPSAIAYWTDEGAVAPMVEDPALWPAIPQPARRLTGTIDADGGTTSIYNGSDSRRALVEWALQRFETAGLPQPVPRSVSFPPSVECVIYEGLATDTGDGVDLDLCFGEEETCTGDDCSPSTAAKSTLLHELGHVWTVQYADTDAREAFLAVRGLEVWNDPGVDRDHLGTEHAAEILAWALLDEPTWAARLPDNDCEDLAAGFRALTGVESPRACGGG